MNVEPPRVFVQLNLLQQKEEDENLGELEWRESCRWIKYEQEVEQGSGRWNPPHVSPLNFRALQKLRRFMKKGICLFDLNVSLDENEYESDFSGIMTQILQKVTETETRERESEISKLEADFIQKLVLKNHRLVDSESDSRYQNQNQVQGQRRPSWIQVPSLSRNNINRKFSATLNPLNLNFLSKAASSISINVQKPDSDVPLNLDPDPDPDRVIFLGSGVHTESRRHSEAVNVVGGPMKFMDTNTSTLSLHSERPKWLDEGSEGALVLAGKIPMSMPMSMTGSKRKKPIFLFVRFSQSQSIFLPEVTEVSIPVRFFILLLTPSEAKTSLNFDLKEIGRSMGTLMADRDYQKMAYVTQDGASLVEGIDYFLENTFLLPSGDYDEELLLPQNLTEKAKATLKTKIRKRRGNYEKQNNRQVASFPLLSNTGTGENSTELTLSLKSKSNFKAEMATVDSENSETFPLAPKSMTNLGLCKTGRYFGGFISEVKTRYGQYLSDIWDGLNIQCFAAILFIAMANISGSIAFGGLMGTKTLVEGNDYPFIGILETLISSAIGGIFFSLFAGQPLLIISTTGPMLLFDSSLITLCQSFDIDFLAIRTWIGLWLTVISLIFVAFEMSSIVIPFFTRFTNEIFAALISLLFIVESLLSLFDVYEKHPLAAIYGECQLEIPIQPNATNSSTGVATGDLEMNQPNTALLCTIYMFGTFGVIWTLGILRKSKFLNEWVRNIIGNFAVPIAMLSMLTIEFLVKDTTVTEKLRVPEGIQPTFEGRSWIVDGGLGTSIKLWVAIFAVFPALLLFILIFMETVIAELIVAKDENKLVKGGGYHLDILVLSFINTLLGFLGLPWVSVALIRAVTHVSALTVWSTKCAPGEKPKIIGVKEQRLTNLVVAILAGASLTMAPLLKVMPMAILFGIFLYMGVASMIGNTFFERLALLFKQQRNHPHIPYVRKVPTRKMHMFTFIQILWLTLLWGIKFTPAALTFPFILILLIPFRFFILPHMLTSGELEALDS